MPSDTIILLQALAILQSARFEDTLPPAGDIVIFAEEWARAFNPRVKALLQAHYRTSQGALPSDSPDSAKPKLLSPPMLVDHEARLRAIELVLFGEGKAPPSKAPGASPSRLPKPFPSKAPKTKPLTTRTLNRRIAREQESADRHTAGLPPLKAPKGSSLKARKKPASK
jgi:hypothetical protein